MLREALEDALARGERLRQDIASEIMNSQIFSDLADNPRFINAVALVIRSKSEVTRLIQQRVEEILEAMKIPTRHQIQIYGQRVENLEKSLNTASRNLIRMAARKLSKKKAAKKTAKRKTVKRKTTKRKVVKKAAVRKAKPKLKAKKRTTTKKRPAKKSTRAKKTTRKAPKKKATRARKKSR